MSVLKPSSGCPSPCEHKILALAHNILTAGASLPFPACIGTFLPHSLGVCLHGPLLSLSMPGRSGPQKQSPARRSASERVGHSLSGVHREQQYGTFRENRRVEQKFTSHLSKPWTTEWAMLKGDNEHASLLLALHQTSEFLAQCTRPTLLSHLHSSYGSHALLGPFLCTLSLAMPAC